MDKINMITDKFGGRKFIFGMTNLLLSFILVCLGKLAVEPWLDFVGVIGVTYVIGNIADDYVNHNK